MNGESSWLKDGVEAIKALADEAVNITPKVVDLPKEKPGTYAIILPGKPGAKLSDTLDVRVAGPLWHNEELATPSDLRNFILKRESDSDDDKKGVVYVGEGSIVYVYDANDRRDRASTPLTLSKPWQWLLKADAGQIPQLSQRDIIRTLRITFGGALPAGSNLIGALRNLNFTNNGTVEANIQHGKNTLGKQILNQVIGIDALPEDVAFSLNVFENFRYPVTVQCALEIYPDVQKFEIVPYPNQLHDALELTLDRIRGDFDSEDVRAYLGKVRAGAND